MGFLARWFSRKPQGRRPPGPSPETPLEEAIRLNRAAARRYEAEITEMEVYWAEHEMACCPGCAFGSRYQDAITKLERVEAWTDVLVEKLENRRKQGDRDE